MNLSVDIKKTFSDFSLETTFSINRQTLGLLGGSGSGKSMTLKCIAGIVTPDEGHIQLNGRILFDSAKRINLPPQKRNVGFLFQHYALFPNMTVEQNIQCGMRRNQMQKKKLSEITERLYLNGLEKRYPSQLSGGQQQRVALARILVSQPELILLDEPFSALDTYLRGEMEREVLALLHDLQKPALVVSHNRDEIYHLCDDIAVYNNGRLDAIGEKKKIFAQPITREAAVLTGCRNVIAAQAQDNNTLVIPNWNAVLQTALPVDIPHVKAVGIRAHYFKAVEQDGQNVILCRIESVVESPFEMIVYLRPLHARESLCWKVQKTEFERVKQQNTIRLHIDPAEVLPLI